MRIEKQEPPFTLKVELTEGCNLACTFCGINSIREKAGGPFNFMSIETASKIAIEFERVGWAPRIEMAMHGEPSMNPNRAKIVKLFREALPDSQIMMTSNGGGFIKDPTESIAEMFEAGLNILALDDYLNVRIVPKIRERYKGPIPLIDYPASAAHSPYKRYPKNTKLLIIMQDISVKQKGVHNRLDNMGGCAAPKTTEKAGKRCVKPFRDLAFRWNGKVALCCDDWRGQYHVGDIHKEPLEKLWNNERFIAARKKLYYGIRDFGPCDGCSDVSTRAGLLPDHTGKLSLPRPNKKDLEIIKKATTEKPWTTIVLRPWEAEK